MAKSSPVKTTRRYLILLSTFLFVALTWFVVSQTAHAFTNPTQSPPNGTPGPISVTDGGTGASTASGARSNLGAAASGANTDITSIEPSGNLIIYPTGDVGIFQTTPGTSFDVGANSCIGNYALCTGNTNEIWTQPGANSGATLYINYRGYQAGFTQYRNLWIGNGEQTAIIYVGAGATPGVDFYAPISVTGNGGSGAQAIIGGSNGCGSQYTAISLNGHTDTTCGNYYNILSGTSDDSLYLNSPSGTSIYFRTNNSSDAQVGSGGLTIDTGGLNMNSLPVTNVPAPVNSTDAANKGYVDAATAAGTLVTWGNYYSQYEPAAGAGAPACPAGYSLAYAGYGPFGYINSANGSAAAASVVVCSASATFGSGSNSGGFFDNYYYPGSGSSYYYNTCNVCVQ